jgi:glycosyltransferase involved in cell wall biosynthesis
MLTVKNRKRPKVLLVGNFLSASVTGTRGVCEDLAPRLRANGWSVVTTSCHRNRFVRLADFVLTVCLRRNNYDVAQVDVYSGLAFVWAEVVAWALRIMRKPYILILRGGNLPGFAQNTGKRVPHLLQSASLVIAPSAYLFEEMRPYRQDLILLPNPLNLAAYSFKPRAHPTPRLVWLRTFHENYNPSLAVRVIASLVEDLPNVRLLMMGPDKYDGSLQAMNNLAVQLGVVGKVTCTGPVRKEDVPQRLHEGDIFLNTARVDNTPVSVLEAMACGLCIISTNVGGIPYMLQDEQDALLVPSGDDAAMAKAVRRVLTEEGLADRLSCNARRKVEQYDWSNVLPKWEKVLDRVTIKH